jgi:hypothetical protein
MPLLTLPILSIIIIIIINHYQSLSSSSPSSSSSSSSSLSHQVANSGTQIRLKSSRFIDHYLYVAALDGPNYHPTGSTGELTYDKCHEDCRFVSGDGRL